MTGPLSTIDVLRAEAKQIHGTELPDGKDAQEFALALNKQKSAALCLSGGGIRSASFALGVMQALASWPPDPKTAATPGPREALLGQFHYLSTVSGGGYIGSWLTAWLHQRGYADILPQLQRSDRTAGMAEPGPIARLRAYSNYLTPKVGIFSADTWAAAAMLLRNLLLNWLVLLPLVLLSLVAVKLLAVLAAALPPTTSGEALPQLLAVCFVLVTIAVMFSLKAQFMRGVNSATERSFVMGNMLPMGFAGVFWIIAVHTGHAGEMSLTSALAWGSGLGLAIFAVAHLWVFVTWPPPDVSTPKTPPRPPLVGRSVGGWLVAGVAFGLCLAVAAFILWHHVPDSRRMALLLVFGLPWFLFSQLVAETTYVAFTSEINNSDQQREWFARSAGWYLATIITWITVLSLALFGSHALGALQAHQDKWMVSIFSSLTLSGVVGWITGGSAQTPARGAPADTLKGKLYNAAAPAAAVVFFASGLMLASAVLDRVVLGQSVLCYFLPPDACIEPLPYMVQYAGCAGADMSDAWAKAARDLAFAGIAFGCIASTASYYININRFSLHGLYRNRLVRAFLGSAHPGRDADNFTGFDPRDNLPMADLWPANPVKNANDVWRPFHVLNLTLNVVASSNLAWQQRKALSFTVSPLHCGAAALTPERDPITGWLIRYVGAFRPSSLYGGAPDHIDQKTNIPGGASAGAITLGTAMAISGAAVNPNMGYHSSPLVSLLLTLLNVRLGWWLGNPAPAGEKTWTKNGPDFAAMPLLAEAFGQSTDERSFVNLSDGGHFENLGLYEMVRRRCRYIVVSDAGCDPDCTFEDLGDSIRKIAIDFGIPITFRALTELSARPDRGRITPNAPYHAIGTIDYSAVDGPTASPGKLLYVKPGFHRDRESAGIRAYAETHPTFPHETTANQWFSESQFEAYRALGYEIMMNVLALTKSQPGESLSLKAVMTSLAR